MHHAWIANLGYVWVYVVTMSDPLKKRISRHALSLSVVVFLLAGAIGLYISTVLKEQHVRTERAKAVSLVQTHAYHLHSLLEHTLSSNYALASLIHEFGGFTRWFPRVAQSLHLIYPEVNNFALSPNGIVDQVYPMEGNEQVIGFNQLKDLAQGEEARRAFTKQEMILTGPVDLVQGGQGVIARLPVLIEDRWGGEDQFWGFTNTVIKIEPLLTSVNLGGLFEQGFSYRLSRTDLLEEILISEQVSNGFDDPVSVFLELPNVQWQLQAVPVDGWVPNSLIGMYVVVSLLVAGVMARFVFLACRMHEQKQQLAFLLSEKTQQALSTARRLSSTLTAIPDPLIEICATGTVTDLHVPSDEAEIYNCFKVGEHFSAHLPHDAAVVLDNSFAEALRNGSHRGAVFNLTIGEVNSWFEVSVVCNQADNLEHHQSYVVLLRDITVRQDAEEQLRVAATAFETQDGILISDKGNHIIKVNKAFERISGYREEEVIGQSPSVFSSGRHDATFYQAMFSQLEETGSWEGEIWNRRKNGEVYPEWLSISTVLDQQNKVSHYVATFRDISESKASERKIRQLNYYDSLTRLANRNLLIEGMNFMMQDKGLYNRQTAVLFIDLDHFKDVNDVWGHKAGDQLLQEVAKRLSDATRAKDTVARFGGDEFILLLEDVDVSVNPDRLVYRAGHVARKVFKAFERPFVLEDNDYQVTVSIGIAIMDEASEDPLEVIKQSELAMYEAKNSGRSQYCFYKASMQERVLARVQLESDLRHALEHDELQLFVQPQWNGMREMVGAEALLRWHHPERGMVSPGVFIPVAEESRLILPIGEWVLRVACAWIAQWQQQEMTAFILSVNVSAVQFSQDDFVDQVQRILKEYNVPANSLQLELTESMLAHDEQDIIAKMEALKALGVLISLDDFGTGYSSLSYLHRLPIDQLKIDQSFVANIEQGAKNASLAESIISLGHSLGMEVIAEGVETDPQFKWLNDKGCDLFQGFGLARPMPVEDMLSLYRNTVDVE